MAAGSKCKVSVDHSSAVARVIFSSSSYLGIEYEAKIDEVITLEAGGSTDIWLYNAAESGPITFGISFSRALILKSALNLQKYSHSLELRA